ncbi:MAG: glycosyltransferase [Gemmatimonadales bacterium]|jgi:glycosyltransferase involved in cell wall biosynthesis
MRLSVAICTWNRADLLAQTLERLTELEIPAGLEWELVVVDNNCTDHTPRVLDDYAGRLPLVPVSETEPGLSHARNRAVAVASGDLIVWTDDDVLVDPGWLRAYRDAANRHPHAIFFGGPVEPWFEGTPPAWLREHFDLVANAYAVRDLSPEPFRFAADPGRLPFGANYAVRREAQLRHPYDPDLGRRAGSMVGGEEIAVLMALLEEGAEGWWVPGARVRHFVPAERQSIAYLRGYFGGQGELAAAGAPPQGRFTWRGRPGWMWKEAVLAEASYRFQRAVRSPAGWIPALKHTAFVRGRLRGAAAGSRA